MKKDLAYFSKLKYNTILKTKNSVFYLFIPELSIIVEGKDLNDAYIKLENEKKEYFEKIIELNAQDTVKEPVGIVLRKKIILDLLSFFGKATIILICLFGIYFFILKSLPVITNSVSQIPKKTHHYIIGLSNNFFGGLDRLSDEDRENLRKKIHLRFKQIKPFVDEIKFLYNDFEPNDIGEKDLNKKQDNKVIP